MGTSRKLARFYNIQHPDLFAASEANPRRAPRAEKATAGRAWRVDGTSGLQTVGNMKNVLMTVLLVGADGIRRMRQEN